MRWGMPPPLRTGVPPVTPPAPAVGQNTGSFRAAPVSSRACKNIPLYRNSEMTYVSPIPAHQEGRSCVVTVASRACGGRGSVGRERSGAGRIALREPKTSCRMSGAARLRLVCKFPAPSTGLGKLRRNGGPCVRQNRVVLAVVATVKCFANAAVASTGALPVTFARTREARGNSAPGRARHKPSNHCAGKINSRVKLCRAVWNPQPVDGPNDLFISCHRPLYGSMHTFATHRETPDKTTWPERLVSARSRAAARGSTSSPSAVGRTADRRWRAESC